MTAVLSSLGPRAAAPAAPTTSPTPTHLPSPAALALEATPMRELERVFQRGVTPALDDLAGWEFRGINHLPLNVLPVAQLAGIKKFVKGFYRAGDGRVMGYNSPVGRNALDGRWHLLPADTAPRRYGFYEVCPVDPTSRDNHYLHAVLLDYGRGDNPRHDPSRGLRDYVVQVAAGNRDLYLGKAYYALGPARLATSFFILERFRRGPLGLTR